MVAILHARQRSEIAAAVQAMYGAVASSPGDDFHFPTGRAAATFVGYPQALLESVPDAALAAFAGVGCPFGADIVRAGDIVLDVGSGSGTDALIAAKLVGAAGHVVALDLTRAMLDRLVCTARTTGVRNVSAVHADAIGIPLPGESIDVVTSNGALNLVLDKPRAFAELFRVLKPGGRLQLADIVLGMPVTDACRADPRLWVECVVGATLETKLLSLLDDAGFRNVVLLGRLNYFEASTSSFTREIAGALNARSIVLHARRREVSDDRSGESVDR